MPMIDMGVDFEDVKNSDSFEPVPSATYEFQVRDIKFKETGEHSKTPGRPMLCWEIELINDPAVAGRRLFYNTVLPWVNPATGQQDTAGCGLLVAMAKGVGKPWTGTQISTDEYLGSMGFVLVGQAPMKSGPRAGEMSNTTKILPQNS